MKPPPRREGTVNAGWPLKAEVALAVTTRKGSGLEASLKLFTRAETLGFDSARVRRRHLERGFSSASPFLALFRSSWQGERTSGARRVKMRR